MLLPYKRTPQSTCALMSSLKGKHRIMYCMRTVQLWSSMHTHTHTHTEEELVKQILNTVSISYTSLPKNTEQIRALSTAPHREKHWNCSTGTKWAYRHTSCFGKMNSKRALVWKATLAFNFIIWLCFTKVPPLNTKGALKWRFLFVIFVPCVWATGRQTATQHI